MKFIKVFSPEVRDKLADMGFSYITENIGEAFLYVFPDDTKIRQYLAENYSKENYIISNRLCF